MTKQDVRQAAKILNEQIKSGKELLLRPFVEQELLSLVTKDILLYLGCRFVSGYKDYMELPYKEIPEKSVEGTILWCSDKIEDQSDVVKVG
jgi:hypothetical protein